MKKNEENRTEFHTGRLTPAEAAEIADHADPAASARFCAAACLAWHCLPAINLGAWRKLSILVSNFNQISKHADEQKIQQGTTLLDLVQVKFLLQKLDGALEKVCRCLFGVTAE